MTEQELNKLLQGNPELSVMEDGRTLEVHRFSSGSTNPVARREPEHDLQVALIAECDRRAATNPLWGLIFAIPNGGKRGKGQGGKLKAEGVRAGVPDLFWPIERRGYCGMFIELKAGDNKPSPLQTLWIDRLNAQGYYVSVIWDKVESAIKIMEWYLKGKS